MRPSVPLLGPLRVFAKEFSDLIGPLKRYLRSCIGRPWSKVHSELSQKLDRRSISGSHIWDHVMWEIETDCYLGPDRLAYSNKRKYRRGDSPIDGLYVHPRTGLIREQHPRRRGHSSVPRPLSIAKKLPELAEGRRRHIEPRAAELVAEAVRDLR